MRIITIASLLLIIFSFKGLSQNSGKSPIELGLRLGDTRGEGLALDAAFPLGENRIRTNFTFLDNSTAAGIYDFVKPISNNLRLHYGAGPLIDLGGLFSRIDLDFIFDVGVEYKFPNHPISLGFDWQPILELSDDSRFIPDTGTGITIRYILR